MPGGQVFGFMFFVLVGVAAWTSAISLLEPTVAYLIEKFKWSRVKASVVLGIIVWAIGISCLLAFNEWSEFKLFGKNMFDLLDYTTANIMLPLGGILTALFAGWVVTQKVSFEEIGISENMHKIWLFTVRFVAPIAVSIVFVLNLK
jgi:NSS family neurotransmitter:Na+ symporter